MAVALATATMMSGSFAYAQHKGMDADDRRAPKTGRTQEGLKVDAEIDKLYRDRAGQQTPNVKADPWGDVRTPSTPAAHPASKVKQKTP
jgi:hypothetical protein